MEIKENGILHILSLEDSARDFELIRELLIDGGYAMQMDRVENEKEYVAALRGRRYDVILADFKLPSFDAFAALDRALEISPSIPFICVSGSIGEETAIELIKKGAIDYVLKDRLERLPFAIHRALDAAKEKDIRRQAEAALKQSEEIFRRFMEYSPIYVFFKDEALRSIRLSKNYETMLGRALPDLLGKNMEELFPGDFAKKMIADDMKILQEGREFTVEEEFNGRIYTSIKFPICIEGEPRYLAGYTIDVTEPRQAARMLATQHALLMAVINSPSDVIIFGLDRKYCYTIFNEKHRDEMKKIWNVDIAIGMNLLDCMQNPELRDLAKSSIDRALGGEAFSEIQHQREVDLYYEFSWSPIFQSGEIVGATVFVRDITARKRAEREVLKLGRTHAVLSNINELIVRERDRGKIFEMACRIAIDQGNFALCWIGLVDSATIVIPVGAAGSGPQDFEAIRTLISQVPQRDLPAVTAITESRNVVCNDIEHDPSLVAWQHCARTLQLKSCATFPLRIASKAVGAINFYFHETNYFNPEEVAMLDELAADISFAIETIEYEERRRSLEKKNAEQARLLDIAVDAIIVRDINDKLLFWNKGAEQLYGYTFDEAVVLKAGELTQPEDLQQYHHNKTKFFEDGYWEGVHRQRTKNLKNIITYSRWTLVRNEDGSPASRLIITRDITEHRRMQDALSQSEERFRSAWENSFDGMRLIDENGTIIMVNTAFCRQFGKNRGDLEGQSLVVTYGADRQERILTATLEHFHNKSVEPNFERQMTLWNGRTVWFEVSNSIIELANEQTLLLSIFRDITERRNSEAALRESEERFRLVWEKSSDGMRLTNEEGTIVSANTAYCEMVEKPSEELLGMPMCIVFEQLRQDEILRKHQERFRSHSVPGHLEKNLVLWNGKNKSFSLTNTFLEIQNQPALLLSVLRDVTKEKQMEGQMRKLSRAVEQSPTSIIITDPTGAIEYVNPRFTKSTGFAANEVLGKNPRVLKSGETSSEEYTHLWRMIASGKEWRGEFHNKKKNGTLFWEYASISPILDEKGIITHFLAVKEDITDRKRTEETLRESEERYRMLIRNQGEGISLSDVNDQFVFANPAAESLFQVPPGSLRGRNLREFILPESLPALQQESLNAGLGERSTFEIEVSTMKGERRSLLVTRTKQSDKSGMYTGTFNVFRDITERKIMEEKLRKSEAYYRTLIEITPDAITILDSDGVIQFASSKTATVFGMPADGSLLGNSFHRFVHPDDHGNLKKHLLDIFEKRDRLSVRDYQLVKSDGTPFWGEISTSPLIDIHEKVTGVLFLCRDVTEKKKMQQDLFQSQKMQSIGTLAGGIAHDFNNILGIILGYVSLMENPKMLPRKREEGLTIIKSAVQRGAALVRQILTFARKSDSTFGPLNVVELLNELVAMLSETFPKTISFAKVLEKKIPYISADRSQIHQALLNLCVNARDAMPHGGIITLSVSTKLGSELRDRFASATADIYLCLEVSDTGEGIEENVRSKVFDPFFTTKEKGRGTGLGLSVVFGVVQAHQGLIELESIVGQGTTFRLLFPTLQENSLAQPSPTLEDAPALEGSETILLVEDEAYLREMEQMTLEAHGYEIYAAHDGPDAVAMYRLHRKEIALVLSDIGLPGMTGIDVFKALKEFDPGVKIIFMSGFIEADTKSELIESGAKGFISKPYTQHELLQRVRAVLDGK